MWLLLLLLLLLLLQLCPPLMGGKPKENTPLPPLLGPNVKGDGGAPLLGAAAAGMRRRKWSLCRHT